MNAKFYFQAAHCTRTDADTSLLARDLTILLGAHNISRKVETGRQYVSVKAIHIHDKWNPATTDYEGDVAVIELTENVRFNNYIRPICIAKTAISAGSSGMVTGWGYHNDAEIISEVLRKVQLPVLSLRECFRNDVGLANIIWDEAFCAGKEGAGVCKGDSGSGFFVERDGKVHIAGIVSSSVARSCSKANIALYSDVHKYSGFIQKVNFYFLF